MSIFKTQDNVPDVYVNASRDFQLLGRLLDANVNDIKYSIDGILMSIDSWTCPSNILPLLLTKLGFFTEYTFEDSVLRQVLQAFPYLMKYKGSKKAIYEAIFLFLRINKLKIPFEIDIVNKGTLGLNYTIIISFASNPFETTLLDEVFKYILPTGYIIRYVFTAEGHLPRTVEPLAYTKDFVEGVIVGNAIDNQLRSTSFDNNYVKGNKVYNDLLSGVDTAVTGEHNDNSEIAIPEVEDGIIQNSWKELSQISLSRNYTGLSIGDKKLIHLSPGTIGNDTLGKIIIPQEGLNLYAEIIDFDHNATIEGYGITFLLSLNKPISLSGSSTSGFSVNSSNTNIGGWKETDIRYYILGSTNSYKENATSTCATNPISNTLMFVLPEDLRRVLKPIKKWTDNFGNTTNNEQHVTETVDYLPLLSRYEAAETSSNVNSYESSKQVVYLQVKNNKIKYLYTDTSTAIRYWLRSPSKYTSTLYPLPNAYFSATTLLGENGNSVASSKSTGTPGVALGVAPIFLV